MYIKLENDFGVDRAKNPEAVSDRELTLNWIQTIMAYGHKNGLTPDNRRIFAGIVKKTEEATKSKAEYLEVNQFEHLFMKKACSVAGCSPQEVLAVTTAEDAINNAVEALPKSADAVKTNA